MQKIFTCVFLYFQGVFIKLYKVKSCINADYISESTVISYDNRKKNGPHLDHTSGEEPGAAVFTEGIDFLT